MVNASENSIHDVAIACNLISVPNLIINKTLTIAFLLLEVRIDQLFILIAFIPLERLDMEKEERISLILINGFHGDEELKLTQIFTIETSDV